MNCTVRRIVSGGQTGADRAALDWAIRQGIEHGGWCPKGRVAEDGPIPPRYHLSQTPRVDYAVRTKWNVRDSDATVLVSIGSRLVGGSALTQTLARRQAKPCLHVHAGLGAAVAGDRLRCFVDQHAVAVLNVAGPRASKEPHVGRFVDLVLSTAFLDAPCSSHWPGRDDDVYESGRSTA